MRYHLTYSTVTPESAEHGDHAEHGYCDENGNRFPMPEDCCGEEAGKFKEENTLTGSLENILAVAERLGIDKKSIEYTSGWYFSGYSVEDYSTGEEIEYCLHFMREGDKSLFHISQAA